MRCESCHGDGLWYRPGKAEVVTPSGHKEVVLVEWKEPCPMCDGSGIAHCCEGERPGNAA